MTADDRGRSLAALGEALGPGRLDTTATICARYARSTSAASTLPAGVAFPTSTAEVQAVVRLAAAHGLAVHPISRGKNWGYGDATAPTDGQIIVDLGRMNRIVEVDERLAYAVIEAGVTQGQLFDHLRSRRSGLWMDCTGAGRDASIVGNALERGFGHTPYSDHFAQIGWMEAVLGDGSVMRTGMGRFDGARAQYLYPHGVGPEIGGLFAQSSLGIVTRAAIWLMPRPQRFCAFFCRCERDADLAVIVDRLAELRIRGVVQSAVHVGNDLRVAAVRMGYPWARAGGETPLPEALRDRLRGELGVGRWNVAGALYGARGLVAASKRVVRRTLGPFHVRFVDDRRLRRGRRIARWLAPLGMGHGLGATLEALAPTYSLMKGEPTDAPLRMAAWRVRDHSQWSGTDPRDIGAGLMWVSPVLPASGTSAREVVDLMEPVFSEYRFEPLIGFSLVSPRALVCVSNISFDARDTGESRRAAACYRELVGALASAGYYPYRTGPGGFPGLSSPNSGFTDVVGRLKAALDPAGVISPGRAYVPQERRERSV